MSNDFKEVCDHLKSSIRSLEDAMETFEQYRKDFNDEYGYAYSEKDSDTYDDMWESLKVIRRIRLELKER